MKFEVRTNVKGNKQLKFIGLKGASSKPDDTQLAKINQFTRRPFTADELYIGQLRLANNCIDRDNERFSEEVLQRFAATAIRKTMLFDHNRRLQESAIGKFFDVAVEKMALQQAAAETGEEMMLPDGVTEVWFLSPWFYIPIKGIAEEILVKIDAGIYDFASIGFRAESLVPIMDKEGDIRFWEYRGSGKRTEMREGSLVYLGAQYGMVVKSDDDDEEKSATELNRPGYNNAMVLIKKGAVDKDSTWSFSSADGNSLLGDPPDWKAYAKWFLGTDPDAAEETKNRFGYPFGKNGKVYRSALTAIRQRAGQQNITSIFDAAGRLLDVIDGKDFNEGGGKGMKDLIKKLAKVFPGKNFMEENLGDEIENATAEAVNVATEKAKKEAEGPLMMQIEELKPLAADGKAYRDGLVTRYVTGKAKLGEASEKTEEQTGLKKIAAGYPIDFLKIEVDHIEKRVAEKFPDEAQMKKKEDENRDKSKDRGKEKENKLTPKEV